MNIKNFKAWLDLLGKAWVGGDPKIAVDICADKIAYFEDPFEPPLTTKEEIFKVWTGVPKKQKDISFKYDIVSISNNVGIAHWTAEYISKATGNKSKLDEIFVVSLNKEGKCIKFQQWWNTKKL